MLEPVFYSRSFTAKVQPWHRFAVSSCTWSAIGGPKAAVLRAQRPAPIDLNELVNLLRCPVELWTSDGNKSWWGLVYGFHVRVGATGVRYTLDDLSNRVRVNYYEPNPNKFTGGTSVYTAWADDLISQAAYGIKELTVKNLDADLAQAERIRDSTLKASSSPKGWPFLIQSPEPLTIELECKGWFDTLDWRYYDQPAGQVTNIPNVPATSQDVGTTAQAWAVQSFQTPVGGWRLENLWVGVKKVGLPTDAFRCGLYTNVAGNPTTLLSASYDMYGETLPVNFSWQKFTFSNPYTLAANTPYWLLFNRSGSLDNTNFYRMQVDESLNYPDGVLRVWQSGYFPRVPDAVLQFQALGTMYSNVQIALMAAPTAGGQFLSGIRFDNYTFPLSNPHRTGLQTCKAELLHLLKAGNSAGEFLADVTPERMMVIDWKPTPGTVKYTIAGDGLIHIRGGAKAPPGPGIAGEWAALETLWTNTAKGWDMVPGRVFLDEVIYIDGACHPAFKKG